MILVNNYLNDFGEFLVDYIVNVLKEIGIKIVGVIYGFYNFCQVIVDLFIIIFKGFKGEVYFDYGRLYNFYFYY